MEKRSTHYGDVSKWVEKVINSCETMQQLVVAKKLLNNFEDKLIRDLGYFNQSTIISPIEITWDIKFKELSKKTRQK
jgi:hypothetical protein